MPSNQTKPNQTRTLCMTGREKKPIAYIYIYIYIYRERERGG